MKRYSHYLALFILPFLSACSSTVKKKDLTGVWRNQEEGCKIKLKDDFTFSSANLPLDVENNQNINFDKQITRWKGTWSVEDDQLKLTMNDNGYYYLDIGNSFFGGIRNLHVKLMDEGGGSMIYLEKQE